jgi:hypothetical protein
VLGTRTARAYAGTSRTGGAGPAGTGAWGHRLTGTNGTSIDGLTGYRRTRSSRNSGTRRRGRCRHRRTRLAKFRGKIRTRWHHRPGRRLASQGACRSGRWSADGMPGRGRKRNAGGAGACRFRRWQGRTRAGENLARPRRCRAGRRWNGSGRGCHWAAGCNHRSRRTTGVVLRGVRRRMRGWMRRRL